MKFEKIFIYFVLVVISGSIGYALKPEPIKEKSDATLVRECTAAIHMMNEFSRKNYYKPKTKKEWAIERMMSR